MSALFVARHYARSVATLRGHSNPCGIWVSRPCRLPYDGPMVTVGIVMSTATQLPSVNTAYPADTKESRLAGDAVAVTGGPLRGRAGYRLPAYRVNSIKKEEGSQ